jgi:eukaryotic-like serine/threonine-protein kinase
MKAEHWRQLDKLFHLALERNPAERAAFLDQACGKDESLRKQVEALLAAHEEAGSFIESPALEVEARSLADDQVELAVGQSFAHYKILSSLGVGGMGEVYLAYDSRLGRKIALKLLPASFTMDIDRVRRFQQEARATSGLNHPNITTIYEIGRVDDRHFIAMEFIDGKTLRQRIDETQYRASAEADKITVTELKLSEVLNVAIQVADALDAAHEVGIVHRDIKPENIMVRKRDGYAKVLDFGLAKLAQGAPNATDPEAPTLAHVQTSAGSVMGTASYMSPEQARGEKVDARTDLWSLGVVLYELLISETPFAGSTSQDVITAILRDEPQSIRTEVPDRLKWIVEKALRKEKDERYQTAKEMLSDLRDLQKHENDIELRIERPVTSDLSSSSQTRESAIEDQATLTGDAAARTTLSAAHVFSKIKRHSSVAIIVLTALVFAVAGIAFGLYKFIGRESQTGQNQTRRAMPFQTMKIARLTSSGKVKEAAVSPDGKYVIHVVDDGEKQSLWMRQVSTSSDVQISPPADISYLGMTFSLGGDYLYYNAWDKKTPFSLYQMPVLGGASRKLIVDIDSVVTFSPDGKQFAFVRGYPAQGEEAVLVANADGTGERKLFTRKFGLGPLNVPAWSPDGKIIAYPVDNQDATGRYVSLLEVHVADGSEKTIGSQRWWRIGSLAWLRDGSGLLFTARERVAGPLQIWFVSYPRGEAQRITNDLADYNGLSLTADSSTLVAVQSEQVSNIWVAPNNNAQRASQITYSNLDGVEGISWTPDGKIVYASGAGGNLDIWITDANGNGQKQLTSGAGNNRRPSVSADGRYVVFISDRTGTHHVWRIDIDGSNPRQLTNGEGEYWPRCSPDGQWVVYQLGVSTSSVWKVPIEGGEAKQVIDKVSGGSLAISPDGKWIASLHVEPNAINTAIYPFEGGEPKKILDLLSFYFRWTPDGRSLAYADRAQNYFSNISSQTVDGGIQKQLTDFKSDRIFGFDWSRDGKQLALARGNITHDVVLISNFREQATEQTK